MPMNLSSPTQANQATQNLRKTRGLAHVLVDALGERIRSGAYALGSRLPTEAEIIDEFGVSRTVVRDAISRLQTTGQIVTRHGIGSFVQKQSVEAGFKVHPEQLKTLREIVAVLELRMGLETEAAALASMRRSEENLTKMRSALDRFSQAIELGGDGVEADYAFHAELASATQNIHFSQLFESLGSGQIPRAKLAATQLAAERQAYLRTIHAEHESILQAIANQDGESARAAMRIHLGNSRERRRKAAESLSHTN
jgi:GntR family transcriptional regulator, transcriptional repressor for pyruvate dehydrogenase complex